MDPETKILYSECCSDMVAMKKDESNITIFTCSKCNKKQSQDFSYANLSAVERHKWLKKRGYND